LRLAEQGGVATTPTVKGLNVIEHIALGLVTRGVVPAMKSLALIGDGVMKAELVNLIDAAGLQVRVRIPGGQPPDQVAEWICASNVLTVPSWPEGYPNVVVEGLACGRPVVATDVGGMREILNERNGILIEPRNTEVLQRALDQALRVDWDLAAIAESKRRTWDDIAVETLRICEQVAAR